MIPFESFLKIVIHQETDSHYFFVLDLSNQSKQFGLHRGQSIEEVREGFILFTWLHTVDNFIGEVDVSLDEVHVTDKFLVLAWQMGDVFGD